MRRTLDRPTDSRPTTLRTGDNARLPAQRPADQVDTPETDATMLEVVTRLIREAAAPGQHSIERVRPVASNRLEVG